MAYTKENIVDYFPHVCNHGKEMFVIKNTYGNDGYAVWFMLKEMLGRTDNHFINLSDHTQLLYMTAEFRVSQELLLKIIKTMVDLKILNEQLWESSKVIYWNKFRSDILDAYKRRKQKPLTLFEICAQFSQNCIHFDTEEAHSDTNFQQSKVDYSKEDYSKVDDVKIINEKLEDLSIRFLENKKLVAAFCKGQKTTEKTLTRRLNDFNQELSSRAVFYKTWDDYTSHFLRWWRKAPLPEANEDHQNTVIKKNQDYDQ